MVKTSPTVVLLIACAIQFALYVYISDGLQIGETDFFFRKDQQQYIFALNWIAYFALGMWLATVKIWQAVKNQWVRFGTPILLFASFWILVSHTFAEISNLVDPIEALRFTRIQVVFFAFTSIVALFQFSSGLHFSRRFINALVKIGEYSFLIYLSHTLVLRMLFLGYRGTFTAQDLVIAACILIFGVVVSSKWVYFQKN